MSEIADEDGKRPVKVYFPCTGLGRQRRGFETFTTEFAAALADDPRLSISVFAGGAVSGANVHALPNIARDTWLAAMIGRLVRHEPHFVEQASFFPSFLPHLLCGRPDVIYFGDLNLGNICWHWRRLTGARYRLLFYNGGAMTTPYTRMDFVQQLTPSGLSDAIARGEGGEHQVVLPHGIQVPSALPPRITGEARAALGLPVGRLMVLSVGLLDCTVKRMDYLVREVASLDGPRPFLVLLGATSAETPALRRLAVDLLGADGCLISTVTREELSRFYQAADVFALASVREGFGLAYVEALLHGLPVVAHDSAVTRYVVGAGESLRALDAPGAAASAIRSALRLPITEEVRVARYASARERFGWDALRGQYADMLMRVSALPL